jgi:hypothetical protein
VVAAGNWSWFATCRLGTDVELVIDQVIDAEEELRLLHEHGSEAED